MKRKLPLSMIIHAFLAVSFPFSIGAAPFSVLFEKPPWHHYVDGSAEDEKELNQLFSTLETEDSPENRFILIQEIIKVMNSSSSKELLNLFLTTYVENHPKDPYNGYYLMIVAQQYRTKEAAPFAAHYYERILRNYPDLLVRGRSIHYLCLTNLIEIGGPADIMVSYYKELLSRFEKEINKGPIYYYLAKAYEELGEWDLSMQAYRQFLQHPNTEVPRAVEALEKVQPIVEYYDYKNKDWTFQTLEDLISAITYALRIRSPRLLSSYRAKVNFFAVSWEQEKVDADVAFLAGLGGFMNQRIYYNSELDADSNNREAYLRTTGWSYRIRTWYLYFRKIHFPADPEIHGQWEWAGIYFGEKPFAGSMVNHKDDE